MKKSSPKPLVFEGFWGKTAFVNILTALAAHGRMLPDKEIDEKWFERRHYVNSPILPESEAE